MIAGHARAASADLSGVGVPGWTPSGGRAAEGQHLAGEHLHADHHEHSHADPFRSAAAHKRLAPGRRRPGGRRPFGGPVGPIFKIPEPLAAMRRVSEGSQAQADAPREDLSQLQLARNFLQRESLKREIEARRSQRSTAQQKLSSCRENAEENKVFIVCSRLPFTVMLEESGAFSIEADPFHTNIAELLASAHSRSGNLERSSEPVLVGAPLLRRRSDGSAVAITEALQDELGEYLRTAPSGTPVVPVFPPPNRDRYADWMIFPLFHYSLPSAETGLGLYDWEGYELVNQRFRDAVLKEYSRGDLVWINDYPLMLLPKLLRNEKPDIPIGFYLHCVFPSSEVYRILPQRVEILRGVLSSNIVGFHNFEYGQQFLNSCTHILGLECTSSAIEACADAGGTTTKVVTVPLGINIEPYQKTLNRPETRKRIQELKETFGNKKLLVAMDRLEEKKGIPHKIMAFHKLLQKDPSWAERCVFLQIVQSTEEAAGDEGKVDHVEQQRLLQQVYQMVGEVNSKFGKIGHLPLHFICQDFDCVDRVALLVKADVMIDTPLRDVLSQSAHEFLCCQELRLSSAPEAANGSTTGGRDERDSGVGVLILSEFSGSAQSLRAAALSVNPWDTNLFAEAIQEALEMNTDDRVEWHQYGRKYVDEYTMKKWAVNFLDALQEAERECETERLQIPPQLDHIRPVSAMRKARRRLFVLGFSGTLVPNESRLVTKILPKLPAVLQGNLEAIAEDPSSTVIIISGLARETLAVTLAGVPCYVIAEGGLCWREPGSEEWNNSVEQRDTEWLAPVQDIMEYFTARTPGSSVIEMSSSVSWVYQNTQGDHAAIQSKDLLVHLWAGPLLSAPAEVVVEKDSVTVRPTGTGKAAQLEKLLQQLCREDAKDASNQWLRGDTFVLCVGDFLMRDEDIFATVQRFFEFDSGDRKASGYSMDAQGDRWDATPSIADRELNKRGEAMHLEANSRSLGSGFDLAATRLSQIEYDKADNEGCPAIPKKTPSEPDLQVRLQEGQNEKSKVGDNSDLGPNGPERMGNTPALFTCTVNRKATRAAYCLSDTNDVAFLIAQLARELRQAKLVVSEASGTEGAAPRSLSGCSGYQGVDSLFQTV